MRKTVMVMIAAMLLMVGCTRAELPEEPQSVSRFKVVEHVGSNWDIVTDRETGVMYAVSNGSYNMGTFTLLVDAEGKPLLYEEEYEQSDNRTYQ